MVARRAAIPLPTVKLPLSRDRPVGRTLPGRGKPTASPLRGNGPLALVEALAEAIGLPPPGTPLPTGLAVPVQRVSEPQLPVRPAPAGPPAAEARVPSEEAPGDSMDPALAPPAAAAPPAWDLVEAEAPAAEAVVGADERESCEPLAPGFGRTARSEK